jgi:hypothetical protein
MLSAGGKKTTTYAHEGTLHLPTKAHLPFFISFRGKKNHVGYFLNSPRLYLLRLVLGNGWRHSLVVAALATGNHNNSPV